MRNCDYYQELISRSLDDELSVEERKALAVHLASCPSCSQMRQLMADISGLMEEDMEELPDGLHEDIMASVRRSEMIKKNGRTGRTGKTNGSRKIKISRPVRNLLATAACMALVIAAAVGLNPGERAESVVMARSAANSTQTQTVTESAAPEGTQAPEASVSPTITPAPTATVRPNSETVSIPQTGSTPVNQGTIITTPAPTADPYAGGSPVIYSGNGSTQGQNHTIINPATPSPAPVSTPAPVETPAPTPTPTPYNEPLPTPDQTEQPAAAAEEGQESGSQNQAAENGQLQQPETATQSEINGEVHKTAPTRVFSMFPSLSELNPEESPAPQTGEEMEEYGDQSSGTENDSTPQPSPTPCPDAEEYDMMNDKEGGRELLLLLMGMQDENDGTAPEEVQLPEGKCDRSYVIAMIFDDIPCEATVKVYGDELYFSLAEIIIDPLETAEDPASVEPSQPVEQPAPEENTMEAEAYDVAGAETQIQVQAQDSSEDFEPIWFRANCSLADFTAKLDSLTK